MEIWGLRVLPGAGAPVQGGGDAFLDNEAATVGGRERRRPSCAG
jgi:hypothetical protein